MTASGGRGPGEAPRPRWRLGRRWPGSPWEERPGRRGRARGQRRGAGSTASAAEVPGARVTRPLPPSSAVVRRQGTRWSSSRWHAGPGAFPGAFRAGGCHAGSCRVAAAGVLAPRKLAGASCQLPLPGPPLRCELGVPAPSPAKQSASAAGRAELTSGDRPPEQRGGVDVPAPRFPATLRAPTRPQRWG